MAAESEDELKKAEEEYRRAVQADKEKQLKERNEKEKKDK